MHSSLFSIIFWCLTCMEDILFCHSTYNSASLRTNITINPDKQANKIPNTIVSHQESKPSISMTDASRVWSSVLPTTNSTSIYSTSHRHTLNCTCYQNRQTPSSAATFPFHPRSIHSHTRGHTPESLIFRRSKSNFKFPSDPRPLPARAREREGERDRLEA